MFAIADRHMHIPFPDIFKERFFCQTPADAEADQENVLRSSAGAAGVTSTTRIPVVTTSATTRRSTTPVELDPSFHLAKARFEHLLAICEACLQRDPEERWTVHRIWEEASKLSLQLPLVAAMRGGGGVGGFRGPHGRGGGVTVTCGGEGAGGPVIVGFEASAARISGNLLGGKEDLPTCSRQKSADYRQPAVSSSTTSAEFGKTTPQRGAAGGSSSSAALLPPAALLGLTPVRNSSSSACSGEGGATPAGGPPSTSGGEDGPSSPPSGKISSSMLLHQQQLQRQRSSTTIRVSTASTARGIPSSLDHRGGGWGGSTRGNTRDSRTSRDFSQGGSNSIISGLLRPLNLAPASVPAEATTTIFGRIILVFHQVLYV